MLPFVKVDDRAHMEPLAVASAAETARVAADVIHTLLVLTQKAPGTGASLVAEVSAPDIDGMENLPAKLMVMGTDYSTMSEQSLPAFRTYRGVFSLRNIPPGTCRLAIERVGSQTLYVPPVSLKAGETVHATLGAPAYSHRREPGAQSGPDAAVADSGCTRSLAPGCPIGSNGSPTTFR